MTRITGADALAALRHVVADKGENDTYTPPDPDHKSCVYVWTVDGHLCPICIVGCALHHLGVPLALMHPDKVNNISVIGLARELAPAGYHLDNEAMLILRAAQQIQDLAMPAEPGCPCSDCASDCDRDATWGAALRAAEQEHDNNHE